MNILGFTFTYAHLIYTVILVILGFFISYYKSNAKFKGYLATLINDAENFEKTGTEKKAWVVDQIYNILPAWMKPILSKTVLSMIVQSGFDSMAQYASKLMDKATDAASTVSASENKSTPETVSKPVTSAEAPESASGVATPAT